MSRTHSEFGNDSEVGNGNRELAEMVEALFARHDVHMGKGPIDIDRDLWSTLVELGLDRLTGDESHGGSGANWTEAALLLTAAGAHAAPVPIAENDLLAGWLLETAGLPASEHVLRTACVLDSSGSAAGVPWARCADRIVVLWNTSDARSDWRVEDVPTSDITVTAGTNLAGEPRDRVHVDLSSQSGTPVSPDTVTSFRLRGALARTLSTAGAMERIQELVVEHVTTRHQFGRPLAKFQAVQQLVADLAAEAALTRAAADAAVAVVTAEGFDTERSAFAVAAATSCAGHAASVVARNAHQVLGAIGFTMEHELHRHTNRILSWRSEFGSVRYWDDILTRAAVDAGSAGLWGVVTDT